MEARLAAVNSTNEDLMAEVAEADNYTFDRGAVQQEIKDLRSVNTSSLAEVARLRSENDRLKQAIREANNRIGPNSSRQQVNVVEHSGEVRASITQSAVNCFFRRSRSASRERQGGRTSGSLLVKIKKD